jgi:glycosyltransferase involved in cell wall biosynthesis
MSITFPDFASDLLSERVTIEAGSMSDSPTWSVMIPVYNPSQQHLTEAIDSVIQQGLCGSRMQIEVVDDCSTTVDVQALIAKRYGGKVPFHRHSAQRGLAGNWNACIERAEGTLIHILHQDDFVEDGYYSEIESLAERFPQVGLYATRNFKVDADSIITAVSPRVQKLEEPGINVEPFFYETPIECAAVTVRRTAYEALGSFRPDMGFVTDCEMWARIAAHHGAVVSPKVKASFRTDHGSETSRALRTTEGIKDICRLNDLLAERHPSFSVKRGRNRVSDATWYLYRKFRQLGDDEAAAANYKAWMAFTPLWRRVAHRLDSYIVHELYKTASPGRLRALRDARQGAIG